MPKLTKTPPLPLTIPVGQVDYSSILGNASSGKISMSALDEVIKQSLSSLPNPWQLSGFSQIAYNCVHHKWVNSFTYLLTHPQRPDNWQVKLFASKSMARALATGSPDHLSLLFSLGVEPARFIRYPLVLQRLSPAALATSLRSPAGDGLVANTFERLLGGRNIGTQAVDYISRLLTSLYAVQSTTPLTSKAFSHLSKLSLSSSAVYAKLLVSLLESPLSHRFLPLLRLASTDAEYPNWPIATATARETILRFRSFSTIATKSTREVIKQGTPSALLAKEPLNRAAWSFLGNLLVGVSAWEEETKSYSHYSSCSSSSASKRKTRTDTFVASLPGMLAEFKPVIAKNPDKFWAEINHLLTGSLPAEHGTHFCQGVLLASLVLNSDVHHLPGFTAHASKFKQAFQAWFVHPRHKTKSATDHALLNSAYLELIKQELLTGQISPALPVVLGGFNSSVANARKIITTLTASNASPGSLMWNQVWEDLFVALSNKLTKKDKFSTLPALEKWRLVHLLPASTPVAKSSVRQHL